MVLAPLSAGFQSLPLLPTIQLGPSSAHSQVGGFVHTLGLCGSLQQTLLWGWEFLLLLPQPPQVFSFSGLRLHFPTLEPWVVWSVTWSTSCCLAGQLQLHPSCSTIRHLAGSASHCLAGSPLLPAACLRPSYWSEWMFLLYLLGCQTSIQFDFLLVLVVFVFKLLLSFFWLCKEAQCVYLCLHLGWKSQKHFLFMNISIRMFLQNIFNLFHVVVCVEEKNQWNISIKSLKYCYIQNLASF